jgi:hypothetical protein
VLRNFLKHTLHIPGISTPKEHAPCKGCSEGKMASKPYPLSSTHATSPFELIHSDLKEVTVGSYHRNHYFVTFIDDYSSHAWITLLRKKSDAHQAMLTFKATVETQYNAKIRRWCFDGGGEFLHLEDHIKKLGIEVEKSLPHEQQQND